MKFDIKDGLPYFKTIAYLTALSVATGLLTLLFGELLMPFYAALLASLFVFDKRKFSKAGIAVASLIVVADTVFCIFTKQYVPVYSLGAVAVAVVFAVMLRIGRSKTESAIAVTVLYTVVVCASLVVTAMAASGSFAFEAVADYYSELFGAIREQILEAISALAVEHPDGTVQRLISAEQANLLLDELFGLTVAFVVIAAFIMAGVTVKMFFAIALRISDRPMQIALDRFGTTNVFAYFYIALAVLSFMVDASSTLGLVVANLYLIFSVVYAYIGFNYIHALLSVRRNPILVLFVLFFAVLFLSSFALTLLSLFGLFYTFGKNKAVSNEGGGFGRDGGNDDKNL